MKIISLFNHKGGVSKTTTTFNLGWMFAEQEHKTLIVDADPQCNLTALVLGYNSIDAFDTVYTDKPNCDIYTCIKPILEGSDPDPRVAELSQLIIHPPLDRGDGFETETQP